MDTMLIATLGTFATVLSVGALLPQVVRTWRTRSAEDISSAWLVAALLSMLVWISYGSLVDAPAIIWANALTFVQASFILVIKLRATRLPLPAVELTAQTEPRR